MLRQPYVWLLVLLGGGMFAAVYLLLGQPNMPTTAPLPAALAPGDQEIAWLNPATNVYAWTRFLEGLRHLKRVRPDLGLELLEADAFPAATAQLPAVGLRRAGHQGTLWLRWHKLTGQQGTQEWLEALMDRPPPPLAFVGGGSSDRARDLALALARRTSLAADGPLLFFTTATADQVDVGGRCEDLLGICPGRSFRFCFTNRQMAHQLLDFIWHEPGLRPTDGCAYLFAWKDDPYSVDLQRQFRKLLRLHLDGEPPTAEAPNLPYSEVKRTWERLLPYSISPLDEPNEREAAAAQELLQDLAEGEDQARALLVLPAEAKSARRLLRTLFRNAPASARRFVAAAGDAVGFNAICRDRRAMWPIQELPCPLALFCHRDPTAAEAGFAPEMDLEGRGDATLSSTDDLLLYADVGAALAESAFADGKLATSPRLVAERLRGHPKSPFDGFGNRAAGAGEFIVLLEPTWAGERVLPQAMISVYTRVERGDGWRLHRRLPADYAPLTPAKPTDGAAD